jgi:RNA polymerase sigma factor (sigma-70 family)
MRTRIGTSVLPAGPGEPRTSRTMTEPTELLLQRIRAGDAEARQALYDRCLPLLLRWAHGRLPHYARTASDTEDLVQTTLLRALKHLDVFESSGAGAFLAYLRHILLNEVRKEIRSQRRHGTQVPIDDFDLAQSGSMVEQLVQQERLEAYEKALASLTRRQQELIVLRIEFGLSYQEIAAEIAGTPDAVRMTIARGLQKMAEAIGDELA